MMTTLPTLSAPEARRALVTGWPDGIPHPIRSMLYGGQIRTEAHRHNAALFLRQRQDAEAALALQWLQQQPVGVAIWPPVRQRNLKGLTL